MTQRALRVFLALAGLAFAPAGADGERLAHTSFEAEPRAASWPFRVSYPDTVARAAEASGPRREDGRWVYRLGSKTSVLRFDAVALGGATRPMLSWVLRVERARWNDDAFIEVRVRVPSRDGSDGEGTEERLWRWDAASLREAKPGRGNFHLATLPEGLDSVEVAIEARASASRGSAWFDLFDLRLDATPSAVPDGAAPQWERPPSLQWVSSDSAIVQWRTRYPRHARLRWGAVDKPGTDAPLPSSWESEYVATEHAVRIGPLPADHWVRYEIALDGVMMAEGPAYAFRSAPAGRSDPAAPIGIWVIGDSGGCSASAVGCERAAAVRDAFVAQSAGRPPSLWFLLGDNAYPHGADWQYSEALFQMYPRVAAATALWPVPGNHDFYAADSASQSGAYFDAFHLPTGGELGGAPSGTEAYYSFDWGPLHVVALDSHDTDRSPGGPMATWLEADLEAASDAVWKIAMFHHPPFSHGSHDSDDPGDSGRRMHEMREVFVPILERHAVDLVLAGHSHGYERSALIAGHTGHSSSYQEANHRLADGNGAAPHFYPKETGEGARGAVYAVVGSSSEASGRMGSHPVMVKNLAELGSLWIEISGDSLHGRFIGNEAQILDDFVIRKVPPAPGDGRSALILSLVVLLGAALVALWAGRRGA